LSIRFAGAIESGIGVSVGFALCVPYFAGCRLVVKLCTNRLRRSWSGNRIRSRLLYLRF
jgi:hypothetical protein